MKVTSYAVARPAYYDRNAVSIVQNYGDSVAPHGNTVRWTTTCAAGKKINIELVNIRLQQDSVATVKVANYCAVSITSGVTTFSLADLLNPSNTVGVPVYFQMSGVPTLYAGETVLAQTGDASTGGLGQYLVALKASSYDA